MEKENKTKNKKLITSEVTQHYSIRKFSVGVASALIGTTLFLGANSQKVQAAEIKSDVVESSSQLASDKDNLNRESNTPSEKEQTPTVTSNEKKDNNATNPSVVNKPTNEQVSASAQDQNDVVKQELSGDTNASGNLDKQQLSHKATSLNTDSNKFELTSTITNNADHDDKNIFAVTVLPNTQDGKSQFDTHLTGPVDIEGEDNADNVINWYVTGNVGKSLDTLLTKDKDGNYEPTKAALEKAIPEGSPKVTRVWKNKPDNWDQVTAVITTVDSLKATSSLKIHLHTYDPSVKNDVGKNAYMSQAVMDSTSFKKLRTGRTIKFVTDGVASLGKQDQPINDVAIYHTNAVTGDIVGDVVLEKGLPEVEFPTFDGYKITSISGGNGEFWQDYDPENPTKILPVTVIKNLQDAKTNKVSGYASILREIITVTYHKTAEHTDVIAEGGNTNTLALFSMLSASAQTPDKVEQHTSIINAGDSNSAKLTVVGKQKINISYIDDTDNKQLGKTDSVEGLPGETAAYSTADRINEYKKQGYDLVSDGTKTSDNQSTLIYDNDYQTDQSFKVHLKHETKTVEDDDSTVTETIHYVYKDGAVASPDEIQTINFKRTGTKDLVTQDVNWNPVDPQTFAKVDSPKITGYTPDVSSIDPIKVNFDDHNIEKTVIYTANDQNAKITYIDDTENKILKTDNADGKFGDLIEFPTDVATQIKTYEDKGYELVSNNFSDNKYVADNSKNVFEVHLTHGYTDPVISERHATWTIEYVGTDHNPESQYQSVTFKRTVKSDKVTGKEYDSGFVPESQFVDVTSPEVNGYRIYQLADNPNKYIKVHQDTKLGPNDTDHDYFTKVPYVKDEPGTDLPDPIESKSQTWTIHYVGLDKNPDDVVQTIHFIKKGDKFVPIDSFKDVDSPEFDGYYTKTKTADSKDATVLKDGNLETIVPYLKDQPGTDLPDPMESKSQTWTIHYVGLDKNPDDVVQTIHFIKKGNKFVPIDSYQDDVKSPEVDGYKVDTKVAKVKAATLLEDGNLETIVIYTKPNETIDTPGTESTSQTWTIKYIGLPSELTPKNNVQTIHFIKKGGKFVPVDSYEDNVKSPEVDGYNVDTMVAKVKDAKLLEDGNLETIIIYTKPNKFVDTPPLTDNKIPNNHIPETHIPDEPTPDIPTPEIPEKQVPQKPTPDPTPEIPDEDAPVKSGNITSDSFVSARTNPTKVVPKKYRNTEKLLPQTGKKNSIALSMLGLATLSLTGLMGIATTKKKRR